METVGVDHGTARVRGGFSTMKTCPLVCCGREPVWTLLSSIINGRPAPGL